MDKRHAVVIGSGIGGLGITCLLARKGYRVTVLEKNARLGGRANLFEADGFRFDMGPSWYQMPDVWEHFFSLLGEKVEDHLSLVRLDPSYRIYFRGSGDVADLHSDMSRDRATFERLEPGSSDRLKEYLEIAAYQYETAKRYFMHRNYDSPLDFFNRRTLLEGQRLHVFEPMHDYVARYVKDPRVQQIIEYFAVFLGSSPFKTPALYSIMSHIDFTYGVSYPQGGIYEIVKTLVGIAEKHGATFRADAAVARILTERGTAVGVRLESGEEVRADLVVSNADIHHTETCLLGPSERAYSPRYWKTRTLAPSAFIMYLGVKGSLPALLHHTLVFPDDWPGEFAKVFERPAWSDTPSYYVCNPSKTDPSVAPEGHENVFVLVPIAPSLEYDDAFEQSYGDRVLALMAKDFGVPDLKERVVFRRHYGIKDFAADYHSFGGSALGLAHTLMQSALFRPSNVSKKVRNLYYVGAGTNPGIGMPTCLISSQTAYKRIEGIRSPEPLASL